MSEWISVKDGLPDDSMSGLDFMCKVDPESNSSFDGCSSDGVIALTFRKDRVRGEYVRRWIWHWKICPWNVTHWMERPEPPNE